MGDDADLLVREYLHLSSILESFDDKLLTIKGWGVTVSLALLGAAVLRASRPALLVAGFGAILFWLLEALYGAVARAHADRIVVLERYFGARGDNPAPLQIYASWRDSWTWWDLPYRLVHIQTIMPNAIVVVVAFALFFLVRNNPAWAGKP